MKHVERLIAVDLAGVPEVAGVPVEFLPGTRNKHLPGALFLSASIGLELPAQAGFGHIDA